MKTSFIASACLLALVLTLIAQSPPPAQNPPGAPATSPAAQAPTNPAAVNPAAPMQSPATNVPQGQQPAVPQGQQQPAVPGTSVPVTLSPAPGAVTSPAAATAISPSPAPSPTPEQPTGFLASNWSIDKFHKGGPVMWPILIVSISALGNEELAVQAVTGGIAEALIATACGLGIAIFSLIPFNFFTSRVSNLEFELQTAATNLEVMLEAQHKEHRRVEIEHGTPASATRSSI